MATLLKEFFRDLPEPLIPKELLQGLLAAHSKKGSVTNQTENKQQIVFPLIKKSPIRAPKVLDKFVETTNKDLSECA